MIVQQSAVAQTVSGVSLYEYVCDSRTMVSGKYIIVDQS